LVGLACVVVAVLADLFLSGRASGDLALFLGRFHPLVVHLPIGILILVALVEAASLLSSLRQRTDAATSFALPLLVVTAVAAFVLGHLLAGGGGVPSKLLFWHRRLTLLAIVGAGLCLVAWGVYERSRSEALRHVYRAMLVATLGVLTAGAHYGGSITRGEGWLTKYAPGPIRGWLGDEPTTAPEVAEPKAPSSEPLVFADVVQPVLQKRCVECHGAETVKGGLRLDSLEAIERGGDNGPVIVKGRGDNSSLVLRMRLPVDDDERMPPEGREGPSAEEIALVAWWIDREASSTLRVRDALSPAPSRAVLEKALEAAPAPSGSAPSPAATTSPSAAPSAGPSADPVDPPQGGSTDPPSTPPLAGASVYDAQVHPILMAKCSKCHGDAKQKGKLRLDSFEAILRGGKEGPAFVAGDPEKSTLVSRARLPLSDPEHMPPPKEPQLTARELELVTHWIQKGGTRELRTAELPEHLRGVAPSQPRPPSTSPATSPSTAPSVSSSAPVASGSSSAPQPPARELPPEIDPFRDVIHPVLVARCAGCHGEEEDQGKLRVDTAELLLAGGRSGPATLPGKPDKSLLVQRMRLPVDDTDHMPPEGQPQPTPPEVLAIEWWIAQGAKTQGTIMTSSLAPEVRAMLAQAMPAPEAAPPGPTPVPSASASARPAPPPETQPEPQGPPAIEGGGCAGCSVPRSSPPSVAFLLAIAAVCSAFARRLTRR
jgi:cytochrome c553